MLFAPLVIITFSVVAALNLPPIILSKRGSTLLESDDKTVEPRDGGVLPLLEKLRKIREMNVKDNENADSGGAKYYLYGSNNPFIKSGRALGKNKQLIKSPVVLDHVLHSSRRRRETEQSEPRSAPPASDITLKEKSYFGHQYGNYLVGNNRRSSRPYFVPHTSYYRLTTYSAPLGAVPAPIYGQPAGNYVPTYPVQPTANYMPTYYSLQPVQYAPINYGQNSVGYPTNNRGWTTTYLGQQPGYYRSANYYGQHSAYYGPSSYYQQQRRKTIPAQVYGQQNVSKQAPSSTLAKSTVIGNSSDDDDDEDEELCVVFNQTGTGSHTLKNEKIWKSIKLLKQRSDKNTM